MNNQVNVVIPALLRMQVNLLAPKLSSYITSIEKITKEFSSGMSEMSIGAIQISKTVENVNKISSKNQSAINSLQSKIVKFKIDEQRRQRSFRKGIFIRAIQ